jgi:hypothetical protein
MKQRRDVFIRALQLNSSSKFIPIIVGEVEKRVQQWKKESPFMSGDRIKRLNFDIFSKILIGEDALDKIEPHEYTSLVTGETE